MVKEVELREKRHETRKRKVRDIVAGMVKRVCTAERLGIDLCGAERGGEDTVDVVSDETLDLFGLIDDMISFCEHPAVSLKAAGLGITRPNDS